MVQTPRLNPLAPPPQSMPHADENVEEVLEKIMIFAMPRRIRVREFFTDFDRRRSGRTSKSQFARALNLIGMRLTVAEVDVVSARFADTTVCAPYSDFQVNYERFCEAIEDFKSQKREEGELPSSPGHLRNSKADWSHKTMSPVKRLQSKVVEKRVRLYDQFQAFDALRKGFCTVGQVKTVFTILALDKELGGEDFKVLQDCYSRSDGMFCYADFCSDIDVAFTKRGLEMDPLTRITMYDSSATLPSRRNRQVQNAESVQKVFDLEEKIRARAKIRRCLLRSAFQDMDRTRRGHVTRTQFARVMGMLGFELTERDVSDLCMTYCDMGNLKEFNYTDFCVNCDPQPSFEAQTLAPLVPRQDMYPKYFDCLGQVHRNPSSLNGSPRKDTFISPRNAEVLTLA